MRRALILLASCLILLSACQGKPAEPNLDFPYIGGTQALQLSFGPGQPPTEIFDDGQSVFNVAVYVQNVGESTIGAGTVNDYGYIELLGINPAQFGLTEDQTKIYWSDIIDGGQPFKLEGARRGYDSSIIAGEIGVVEFPEMSYVSDRVGNVDITIRANACYEYSTRTDANICIKDNVLESAQDDTICTLTGVKEFMSSGGPVQVTDVSQNPAGRDKISVTFTIENLGTGQVFAPVDNTYYTNPYLRTDVFGRPDACLGNIGANPARDVVFVEVEVGDNDGLGSGFDINCPMLRGGGPNYGIVTLFQNAPATVTCSIRTLGQSGSRIFVERLHVNMHYTYLDFIEMPILIRDTNVGAGTTDFYS